MQGGDTQAMAQTRYSKTRGGIESEGIRVSVHAFICKQQLTLSIIVHRVRTGHGSRAGHDVDIAGGWW